MHPILFRVPLPHSATQWTILVAVLAALILGYAAYDFFGQHKRTEAAWTAGVAALLFGARFGIPILFKGFITSMADTTSFPIYSYGVMLGSSLVVGWFLTLTLAERDGLPRDQMGDCYVDTAIMAVIGSRVLYILTNLDQFQTFESMFAFRSGGLVAYGGFLGGWLGSWLYLRFGVGVLTTIKRLLSGDIKNPWRPIPILPWADVAVPSLASGLMITRVGCYLFGCDFGKRLSDTAPGWLKGLGTFPHWSEKTLEHGEGAPAWVQHVKAGVIGRDAVASAPVHPTQIYESLVGAGLLVLLLSSRKHQKFRGQICFLFFFAYGICRYLLEVVRDDDERGSLPPALPAHVLIPLGLAVFAVGYGIGFSQQIKNLTVRRVTQVAAFLPTVVGYLLLKPETFGEAPNDQWSTSQFIGMATALAGCIGFNILYRAAKAHPERAMDLGIAPPLPAEGDDDDEDDDEDSEPPPPPPPKKKAKKAGEPVRTAATTEKSKAKPKPKSTPPAKAEEGDEKHEDKEDDKEDEES